MRPWGHLAFSAPVAAASAVILVYSASQRSFSDGMLSGTFNFMLVFQTEHNILTHSFHMLGAAGVFGGSLFSAMHGSLVTLPLICKTSGLESLNYGYLSGQEEETYNIVATHGYFGNPMSQHETYNGTKVPLLSYSVFGHRHLFHSNGSSNIGI